ncbi:MAG: nicotinate phosphoribosyltransferase [Anaerolineales bacterium]
MNSKERSIAEGILLTDQYQLTMAQLYYRMGLHEKMAQFDHFFRSYPDYGQHQTGYCINAGLEWLLDWMAELRVRDEDIGFLRSQKGSTGEPVFSEDFLSWMSSSPPFADLTMKAIPEGRVVHPNVPLTVVQGPLAWAQILETSLLNHLNYQTLIATKASRIRHSGGNRLLLEFGLRRGPEKGANAGTRAALIGGADFSSNVGASHVAGYEPKGTHAHSMVQVFIALGGSELDAFRAYADVYPDDCLLLVDTVDTLESGIPNAIRVFEELRREGHQPVGIRLDSGDLAYLSIQARKMLDEAGFEDTIIVLSNQLDELVLWQILTQIRKEAQSCDVDPDRVINSLVYGVGTRLIISQGHCALDGVYKLVAVRENDAWVPALKISENPAKVPNPGHKHVWRVYDQRGKATADVLSLDDENPAEMEELVLHHPSEHTIFRTLHPEDMQEIEPLLEEVWADGKIAVDLPPLEQLRERREEDLSKLDPGVCRLMNPHIYHVSLTERLWNLKRKLIEEMD